MVTDMRKSNLIHNIINQDHMPMLPNDPKPSTSLDQFIHNPHKRPICRMSPPQGIILFMKRLQKYYKTLPFSVKVITDEMKTTNEYLLDLSNRINHVENQVKRLEYAINSKGIFGSTKI